MSASNMSWPSGPLYIGGIGFYPLVAGNVFFVDGNIGADGPPPAWGKSWAKPFDTIDYAIGQCSANNGDVILVAPGHTETVSAASGINADVAGITIIGLGEGTARPTITSASVTGATVVIGAANVRLYNLLFVCGIDSQTIMLDINSTDALVERCEFRNVSGAQILTAVDINGGGANACDRAKVFDCLFRMSDVGSARAIELGEVADGVEIRGTKVWGDFDDACIHNPTGKVLTNLTIADCELTNLQSGDHSIELVSACTGNLIRNMYHNNMTQATGVDPGSCFSFECYHDDVIDTNGILAPVAT